MSSPIYELLKRPDELFVVEHAHLTPRFVEDSVRLMVKYALDEYPELADDDFVLARQMNFETIHNHEVLAERFGTVGELRRELETGGVARHTSLATGSRTDRRGGACVPAAGRTVATARATARLRSLIRCSVPARSRPMLARWRTITATAAAIVKTSTGIDARRGARRAAASAAATIEATDA